MGGAAALVEVLGVRVGADGDACASCVRVGWCATVLGAEVCVAPPFRDVSTSTATATLAAPSPTAAIGRMSRTRSERVPRAASAPAAASEDSALSASALPGAVR